MKSSATLVDDGHTSASRQSGRPVPYRDTTALASSLSNMGIDTPQLREPSLTGGKLSVSLYLLAFRLRAAALRSSHAPTNLPRLQVSRISR